jgi:outer membrane murein-binding lipoprotein Lpp
MSSNTIRRALLGLAAVGSLTLAGCASLAPRELLLSQAELQTLLERQFPRQQRVLDLLDVNLLRPRVRLAPERNRIVTALDLNA